MCRAELRREREAAARSESDVCVNTSSWPAGGAAAGALIGATMGSLLAGPLGAAIGGAVGGVVGGAVGGYFAARADEMLRRRRSRG